METRTSTLGKRDAGEKRFAEAGCNGRMELAEAILESAVQKITELGFCGAVNSGGKLRYITEDNLVIVIPRKIKRTGEWSVTV